jgi:hypothetical protein
MLRNKSVILDINILFPDFDFMVYIALFLMKKQELCHPQKLEPKNDMSGNDVKN